VRFTLHGHFLLDLCRGFTAAFDFILDRRGAMGCIRQFFGTQQKVFDGFDPGLVLFVVLSGFVDWDLAQMPIQFILNHLHTGRFFRFEWSVSASDHVGESNRNCFQLANPVPKGSNLIERSDQGVPIESRRLARHFMDGSLELLFSQPLAPQVKQEDFGEKLLMSTPAAVSFADRDKDLDHQCTV
jgi:hypothetical protein